MSLTIEQLRAKVESLYPEVQQINETVLRYVRKTANMPIAVYYLDVGVSIPQSQEMLNDYLNRVVGKSYFEGASSLQWNNYLYFVRSANQLKDVASQKAKELVEQDRVYARKFVITEPELDSVLCPQTQTVTGDDGVVDAISPWVSILKNANLIEAVLGEHSMPKRIELIEKPPTVNTPPKLPKIKTSAALLPQISKFEIKDFSRHRPKQRIFQFGAVNLIFGPNGAGKTSLLEAIELYYCGKTRRNPKDLEDYDFNVFENGELKSVNQTRELQALRNHNLEWYGVREERSTKLCDGFGRFNFLNTDAAIELSQLADNINDDLAKLLVGSDAARTWQVIEKLSEKIRGELRESNKLQEQVSQELDLLIKQLAEIGSAKKESDTLGSALNEALRRRQWIADEDLPSATGKLIADLAELKAVSEQVGELHWLKSPVTFSNIVNFIQESESSIHECEPKVRSLKETRVEQRQLSESMRYDQEAITLLGELSRFVKSGIEQRTSEMDKQSEIIAKSSSLLAGVDEETLRIVANADSHFTVGNYQASTEEARKCAEESFLAAKQKHADFVKSKNHSLTLTQELREIASRILENGPADECPLCHTHFKSGELASRISFGVDEHLEEKAQKLLENVRHMDESLAVTIANEKAATKVASLCVRMKFTQETILKDVISNFEKAKNELADAQEKAEVLESEISSIESQGLSLSRLNDVTSRLNELGVDVSDRTEYAINNVKDIIAARLTSSRKRVESIAKEEKSLIAFIAEKMSSLGLSDIDPIAAIGKLNERFAETRSISSSLKRFLPLYKWEVDRPIVEWIVESEEVRKVAVQLQDIFEKERLAAKIQTETSQRKDKLTLKKQTLTDRIECLSVAQKALNEIQTKHSLKAMTESALEANRESIESVFSQIHAPAEFKGVGPDWTLIRKLDNTRTPLTMVSTGQRAAFALAVFLAQNAQLRSGPPVILIDDPIAHIDDLNSLSFLDYLREIALTGRRQIYFATANSKLASLFERKFDFLGEKFRRINLTH